MRIGFLFVCAGEEGRVVSATPTCHPQGIRRLLIGRSSSSENHLRPKALPMLIDPHGDLVERLAGVTLGRRKCALMQLKQGLSAVQYSQLTVSTAAARACAIFYRCSNAREGRLWSY